MSNHGRPWTSLPSAPVDALIAQNAYLYLAPFPCPAFLYRLSNETLNEKKPSNSSSSVPSGVNLAHTRFILNTSLLDLIPHWSGKLGLAEIPGPGAEELASGAAKEEYSVFGAKEGNNIAQLDIVRHFGHWVDHGRALKRDPFVTDELFAFVAEIESARSEGSVRKQRAE
ncbi:hypothetical protein PILCRDRAFT_171855 [Piloderma croceum F 1598]|uniref:Uncharacterized protein n=1 Tax=Piloderma croceum (strain F 1598) TaxID=765440 RepID=A0A0C3CKB0_PILCF|nr:hypothetical protein PILCRDRAFT_171855 [Piloderma croceum F 1598]